jgi:hypothetical protein
MNLQIYDKHTIDTIAWPETENGEFARQYLLPIIKQGTRNYFTNIHTDLQIVKAGDIVLPITVNDSLEPNAYVCSTYTHYVMYALEEIKEIKNTSLRKAAQISIKLFGTFLKWGLIDKTVFVNNWLLPTNLYPSLSKNQLQAITSELIKRFPRHAIAFRSVNSLCPCNLMNSLLESGFRLLICRDIYYTDTSSSEPFKARMTKSDFKALESSEYSIVYNDQIPIGEADRLAGLYHMLNIDKYSSCNPQYKPELLDLFRTIPRFTLKAWVKNQRIDAVLGYYAQEGMATSPLFGYDTTLPQHTGLYRQISAELLKDAKKSSLFLHQSSGAGNFKQLRRANKTLEYTALQINHLPWKRQLPWRVLCACMNTAGKKILNKGVST